MDEAVVVSWVTVRREQIVLAPGTGQIAVLASVIKMCI